MLLLRIVLIIPSVLIGIIAHEFMHGWVAYLCGDRTAKEMGRLTLNPIAHLDLMWSIIIPLILAISGAPIFAMAKPVPINPANFRHPKRDLAYVGIAGPLTNIGLAALVGFGSRLLWGDLNEFMQAFVVVFMMINLILALFNLIPIPPLDGSRVVEAFLPPQFMASFYRFERYGIFILFLIIIFFPGVFWGILLPIISYLMETILPGSLGYLQKIM